MIFAHQNAFGEIYFLVDGKLQKTKSSNRTEFLIKLAELRVTPPADLTKNPPKGIQGRIKREVPAVKVEKKRTTTKRVSKFPEGTVKGGKILTDGRWVPIK